MANHTQFKSGIAFQTNKSSWSHQRIINNTGVLKQPCELPPLPLSSKALHFLPERRQVWLLNFALAPFLAKKLGVH
jgi:hypothetical protein